MLMRKGTGNLLILFIILSSLILGCLGGDDGDDDWGADGRLEVKISVNRKTMDSNSSIMVTFKLINNGTTRLRVIPPENLSYDHLVEVLDEDLEKVEALVDVDNETLRDEDLYVLEPGEELPMAVVFSSYYYDIEAGNVYYLRGRYATYGGDFTLTRWEGEQYSETIKVSVY